MNASRALLISFVGLAVSIGASKQSTALPAHVGGAALMQEETSVIEQVVRGGRGGGGRAGVARGGGGRVAVARGGGGRANVNVRSRPNVNVRRNTNLNVRRGGAVNVVARRPVRVWAPRAHFGTIVGGVALGTIIAVTVAGATPVAPAPNLCWFWSDPAMINGYWDYCVMP